MCMQANDKSHSRIIISPSNHSLRFVTRATHGIITDNLVFPGFDVRASLGTGQLVNPSANMFARLVKRFIGAIPYTYRLFIISSYLRCAKRSFG